MTGHHFSNTTNHFDTISTFLVRFQIPANHVRALKMITNQRIHAEIVAPFGRLAARFDFGLVPSRLFEIKKKKKADFLFSSFPFPQTHATSFLGCRLTSLIVPQLRKLRYQRERWLALCQRCFPKSCVFTPALPVASGWERGRASRAKLRPGLKTDDQP